MSWIIRYLGPEVAPLLGFYLFQWASGWESRSVVAAVSWTTVGLLSGWIGARLNARRKTTSATIPIFVDRAFFKVLPSGLVRTSEGVVVRCDEVKKNLWFVALNLFAVNMFGIAMIGETREDFVWLVSLSVLLAAMLGEDAFYLEQDCVYRIVTEEGGPAALVTRCPETLEILKKLADKSREE